MANACAISNATDCIDLIKNSIGDNLFQQALLGGNQACDVSLGLAQGNRADFMVLDDSNPFVAASES